MIFTFYTFCKNNTKLNCCKEMRNLELEMISSQEKSTKVMVWKLGFPGGDAEERKGGVDRVETKALEGGECLVRADEVFLLNAYVICDIFLGHGILF